MPFLDYHWKAIKEAKERELRSNSAVERLVSRLLCWWFGCYQHEDDPAPPEYAHCVRCDGIVSYADMVGDTKHNRSTYFLKYWCFRKWWPAKCGDCGRRFGCHEDCLPF